MEKWHRDLWQGHTNRYGYIVFFRLYSLLYSAINWISCNIFWKNGIDIFGDGIPTDMDILWKKFIQSSLDYICCFTQQLTEKRCKLLWKNGIEIYGKFIVMNPSLRQIYTSRGNCTPSHAYTLVWEGKKQIIFRYTFIDIYYFIFYGIYNFTLWVVTIIHNKLHGECSLITNGIFYMFYIHKFRSKIVCQSWINWLGWIGLDLLDWIGLDKLVGIVRSTDLNWRKNTKVVFASVRHKTRMPICWPWQTLFARGETRD